MSDAVPVKSTIVTTSAEEDGGNSSENMTRESPRLSFLQAIRSQPQVYLWCLYALFTLVLTSFDNQAGGVVLGIPQFRKHFGKPYNDDYVLYAKWQSAYSGAPVLSSVIGYIGSGWLADRIGRKWTFAVGHVLGFVAITIEATASTNPFFFAGKFMSGFVIGAFTTTALTYLAEIVPSSQTRGLITTSSGLALTFGPFIVALVVKGTGDREDAWAYRSVFLAQYGFSIIGAMMLPWLPESPWWLLSKKNQPAAALSLSKLGYSERQAKKRIETILVGLDQAQSEMQGATFVQCFKGINLRRTIVSSAPLTIQALSGTAASFNLNIIQQILAMFGNICSWFMIDRIGRRPLSFYSMTCLTVILLVTGGIACVGSNPAIKGTVGLLLVYIWVYNLTIGATAYPILVETPTRRLRAKTASIGLALQNLIFAMWAFVVPYLFNPDQANLGARVTFIFGAFAVLSTIYLWLYQPETSGRSFEHLDEMFLKCVPARAFKTYRVEADTGIELSGMNNRKTETT